MIIHELANRCPLSSSE